MSACVYDTASSRCVIGDGIICPLLRFSKYSGGGPVEYPLNNDGALALRSSDAESPVLQTDSLVMVSPSWVGSATHPDDSEATSLFWAEFEEVVDFQLTRRADPSLAADEYLTLPLIMQGFSLTDGADAVHSEFPNTWPTSLVKELLGAGARMDPTIVPQRSQTDFVNTDVLLARMTGWAVSVVSPSAFACKWANGRARPEEVAWAVAQGAIAAPDAIASKVQGMQLTSAADFTAYPEGSPRHPSYPAMHSAASSSSLWLAVVMDLTDAQIAEARRVDWAVSRFRTFAGVHYDSDNRAGLALGQEVIARELASFLQTFGADAAAVEAKIARYRFDWFSYTGFE